MTYSNQLSNRLRETILNGTRVANTNYKEELKGLDWKIAMNKVGSLNTIALLAQHIHYYIEGVKNALLDGQLTIKDIYSYDFVPLQSQKEWVDFLNRFWENTETLAQLIEVIPEKQLKEKFIKKQYGDYSQNINILIEHSYYHLGQIVLIKKLIS